MYQFVQNISSFLARLGFTDVDLWWLGLLVGLLAISVLVFLKYASRAITIVVAKPFKHISEDMWLEVNDKLKTELIIFFGVYFAIMIFPVPGFVKVFFTVVCLLFFVIFLINSAKAFLISTVKSYLFNRKVSAEATTTVINFVNVFATIVLGVIATVIILIIFDVDIEGLLGSLGVASIIVAFAIQNVLKDIFAFFTLYVDRAFSVGDYVKFGEFQGAIKEIRLRSTRIKALLGNELIVPNSQLTSITISNYNRFQKRRIQLTFKVKVAPAVKIAKVVAGIKERFASGEFGERVTLNTVVVDELTDTGIQIKIIYRFAYIHGESNFFQHLGMKEKVNLAVMEVLEQNGVDLIQLEYTTSP